MADGKYARKRRARAATRRSTVEEVKQVDGRTQEIAEQVPLDGSRQMDAGSPLLLGHAVLHPNGFAATPGAYSAALAQAINVHGHPHDHNYAAPNHTHPFPNETQYSSVSGRHKHSISFTPFIKYPREERLRMLAERSELEEVLKGNLDPLQEIMARNLLNSLKLHMDYDELDAYEREVRLVCEHPACKEWAEEYKRVYGVDEYAQEDRDEFLNYGPVRMDPHRGIIRVA